MDAACHRYQSWLPPISIFCKTKDTLFACAHSTLYILYILGVQAENHEQASQNQDSLKLTSDQGLLHITTELLLFSHTSQQHKSMRYSTKTSSCTATQGFTSGIDHDISRYRYTAINAAHCRHNNKACSGDRSSVVATMRIDLMCTTRPFQCSCRRLTTQPGSNYSIECCCSRRAKCCPN